MLLSRTRARGLGTGMPSTVASSRTPSKAVAASSTASRKSAGIPRRFPPSSPSIPRSGTCASWFLELEARAQHVLPALVVVVREQIRFSVHILILILVGQVQRLRRELEVLGDVP